MNKITYVTGNAHKFSTVSGYVRYYAPDLEVVQAIIPDLHEIQDSDQRVVALDKARKAWPTLKQPILIDDDGIYFEKYRDFPGVFTKQVYECLGVGGLYKLVQKGDAATCKVTMVYWYGPEHYHVFEGVCPGTIAEQPSFTADPGDPMFIPNGTTKNCAELYASGDWQQYDYRIDALKQFLAWYKKDRF